MCKCHSFFIKIRGIANFVFVALCFVVTANASIGWEYCPGRWTAYDSLPADLSACFVPETEVSTANVNVLVVKDTEGHVISQYISGLFSHKPGYKTLVDALIGIKGFTNADCVNLNNVLHAKNRNLPIAQESIKHLKEALHCYLDFRNGIGVPLAKLQDVNNFIDSAIESNIAEIQKKLSDLKNLLKEDAHSEMTLAFEIAQDKIQNPQLVITSKLDMCGKCEIVLNNTIIKKPKISVIIGAYKEYSNNKPFNPSRRIQNHDPSSRLYKVVLGGAAFQSAELALKYPNPAPDSTKQASIDFESSNRSEEFKKEDSNEEESTKVFEQDLTTEDAIAQEKEPTGDISPKENSEKHEKTEEEQPTEPSPRSE